MSVRIISAAAINALATCAKTERIRGVTGYSANGIAWALLQANLASLRAHYGARTSEMFPELPEVERRFRYEVVEMEADKLIIHLVALMCNSMSHDNWDKGDAWRILCRLAPWIVLRRDIETTLERSHRDIPEQKATTRFIRRQAARLNGRPWRGDLQPINNQPSLFTLDQTDPARSLQPAP